MKKINDELKQELRGNMHTIQHAEQVIADLLLPMAKELLPEFFSGECIIGITRCNTERLLPYCAIQAQTCITDLKYPFSIDVVVEFYIDLWLGVPVFQLYDGGGYDDNPASLFNDFPSEEILLRYYDYGGFISRKDLIKTMLHNGLRFVF